LIARAETARWDIQWCSAQNLGDIGNGEAIACQAERVEDDSEHPLSCAK